MIEFLIVFLPLFGAIFAGCFIKFKESIFLQFATTFCVGLSAILSWFLFFNLKDSYQIELLPWINAGNFSVQFAISIDKLSALMFVVVNTVSFVVHAYSMGYMQKDKSKSRFFCYLSFFTFAMLILVCSSDLLQLFLGWEGVGFCSYLLIGFWFQKNSANLASLKSFIVNRIGDFSFLIGIFAIYKTFGTVNFNDMAEGLSLALNKKILGVDAITFACIALFFGCMSKSAQIGLHTWLPDAMEGPTPVSALIHAATMVTAGVFLVVKLSFLFEISVIARSFILVVGSVTAIFAASIAVFQTDIKKIIAYSTCSQLGYMFVACGVSAYNLAMFHLAAHAFFKALLFLCAGNVIHSVDNQQEISKMGGLANKIPSTFYMMLIGSLALCGIFPFAGFYSKDLIIEASYVFYPAFIATIFSAFLTSLYSFKIVFTVFFGKTNFDLKKLHKPQKVMILPLLLLAVLSISSGFFAEHFLHITDATFWSNAIILVKSNTEIDKILKLTPLAFASLGIFTAFALNKSLGNKWTILNKSCIAALFVALCSLLSLKLAIAFIAFYLFYLIFGNRYFILNFFINSPKNKYYFDQIYDAIFVRTTRLLSIFAWKTLDKKVVDKRGADQLLI